MLAIVPDTPSNTDKNTSACIHNHSPLAKIYPSACRHAPHADIQPLNNFLSRALAGTALVDFLVDLGNLTNPHLPFLVFHVEDVVYRPMEMISDIRYLLIQLIQGVA